MKKHQLDNLNRPDSNQKSCFGLILLVANRMQTKLDTCMGDLTLKQWHLVCMLGKMKKETINVNDLANVVGYSRQNVKKMVDILVKKEYLRLESSTTDKRAYQIHLTEKSQVYILELEKLGDELLSKIFEDVSKEELGVVESVMKRVINNLDEL